VKKMMSQKDRYENFYSPIKKLKWLLRFDVSYRCKRIHEVFSKLNIDVAGKSVIDFGFGAGALLKSFPSDCSIMGADVSSSAVASAAKDKGFKRFKDARFEVIPERDADGMPKGPFDLVISSHALEHVHDDAAVLETMYKRLRPGGLVALFVPIEEPDYIEFHVRNYSIQSFTRAVADAGFDLLHVEGSMYVNGHMWKLLTIPSRRSWPVISKLSDALRLTTLSMVPYSLMKISDELLYRLGFGARQVLVVAQKPKV
jgi:2-polyprenyl-3-methyl-5-hydroxy-6-metoxy-1,4-benzoquinol methylase